MFPPPDLFDISYSKNGSISGKTLFHISVPSKILYHLYSLRPVSGSTIRLDIYLRKERYRHDLRSDRFVKCRKYSLPLAREPKCDLKNIQLVESLASGTEPALRR
jgi:hypothetical protein